VKGTDETQADGCSNDECFP